MGFNGGGGTSGVTTHKHTNAANDGGALDADVTLMDAATMESWYDTRNTFQYGAETQTTPATSDTTWTIATGKYYFTTAATVGSAGNLYLITSVSIWAAGAGSVGILLSDLSADPPTATTINVYGSCNTTVSGTGEKKILLQNPVYVMGGTTITPLVSSSGNSSYDVETIASQNIRFAKTWQNPQDNDQITGITWEANTRRIKSAINYRQVTLR